MPLIYVKLGSYKLHYKWLSLDCCGNLTDWYSGFISGVQEAFRDLSRGRLVKLGELYNLK